MRPGGTPEAPKIVIDGRDMNLLKFGMTGNGAALSPCAAKLGKAFLDLEAIEGREPDFLQGTVDVDATPANLALCGLALTNAKGREAVITGGNTPDPRSVTSARIWAEVTIIGEGLAVLEELAGGEQPLQELMDTHAEKWRTEYEARRGAWD